MPSERLAALAIERVERIMALNMSFSRREAWDHAVLQYILDAQEERERRLEQMPSDKQRVICKVVLPAWAQEISERADRATKGPWYLVNCDDRDFASMLRVTTAPDSERPEDTVAIVLLQMPLEACVADERWDENAAFIAHSRADVPRLVELVGEMAWNLRNVTDQVQDACRSRMTPLSQCPEPSDDYCPTCPTGLRGECGAPRSLEALRKFRGEVSSND